MDTEVQRALERAQASNTLKLEGFWLTEQSTQPVFKALLHQTQLQILDLSNNFIRNEGCRQLAKAISTLKQLKALNLKGNFITCDGLEAVLLGLPGQHSENTANLENLEDLNVSQNPLGNDCARILDKFCNNLSGWSHKSLQKLALAHCGISNLYDYDLCYYQLTDFDISFNQLLYDSKLKLLTKLNSCRMQSINLSYSSLKNHFGNRIEDADNICKFFESGTCEKFKKIELTGCDLEDSQIYRIALCLKRATALELLDITDNVKLTSRSLQYILDEIPYLRKLIATNCHRLVDSEQIRKLSLLKSLPSFLSLTLKAVTENIDDDDVDDSIENVDNADDLKRNLCDIWREKWNTKAFFRTFNHNLVLYTNDKDLI